MRETYRGVELAVTALHGQHEGHVAVTVNGADRGWVRGTETGRMRLLRARVDAALENPDGYPPFWQPGFRRDQASE